MNTKQREVTQCVDEIASALDKLRAIMSNPESLYFGGVRSSFEKLEFALRHKTSIDASFAYLAERDDAGRHVGSSKAHDYLTGRLGISGAEAHARLKNGRELFTPLTEPVPAAPEVLEAKAMRKAEKQDGEGIFEDQLAAAREAVAREEEQRLSHEKAEKEAAEARRKGMLSTTPVAQHVQAVIERELEHLSVNAQPGPQELRRQAMLKAQNSHMEIVRHWLREEIRQANRRAVDASGNKVPHAARAKHRLHIGRPDADGGVFINGYVDAVTAALLKTALSPARNPGKTPVEGDIIAPEDDTRSYQQRLADQLEAVLKGYLAHADKPVQGLGSIVITMTADEIEKLAPDSKLSTNTGVDLSPLDLFRLGAAKHDYVCVVDDEGLPLELGRTKRTASVWQKLALAATELVCTHPDCSRAWTDCDVHHLQAWQYEGPTDISNLTLLCRRHHVDNNDDLDGRRNMGHAERCRTTGRVGHRAAGSPHIRFNEHPVAQKAAARRLLRPRGDRSVCGQSEGDQAPRRQPEGDQAPRRVV